MEGFDYGEEIRGAVVCFSGAKNRGSLALVLCVCVPVQKKNCSSGLEEKLQQQVFIQHKKKKYPDLYSRFG